MNYKNIYKSLIEKALVIDRKKNSAEYFEKHHIIPRSHGGTNKKCNLVLLTAKEHFIAHHLLSKIYDDDSMKRAFWMMCHVVGDTDLNKRTYRITSVVYASARKAFSVSIAKFMRSRQTGITLSDEHKNKISRSLLGNKRSLGYSHSDEAKAKIAASSTGRLHTDDAKEKISIANIGKTTPIEVRELIRIKKIGQKHSDETKERMSIAHKGKEKTEAHRENLRAALLGEKSHRFGLVWFTNGEKSLMAKECPEGYKKGRTVINAALEVENGR